MPVPEQVVFGIDTITLTPYSGGTAVVLDNPEDFSIDVAYSVEELYGGNKPWMIAAGVKDIKGKITGQSATLSLDALKLLSNTGAITSVGTPEEHTLNFANTDVPQYFKAECRVQMAEGQVIRYVFNRVLVTGYKIGAKRGTFTLMDFSAVILTDPATGNVGFTKVQTTSGQVTP
jgi:hypothetical protein